MNGMLEQLRPKQIGIKATVISGLIILLLIPLSMTSSVLQERQSRRDDAVKELSRTWGEAQTIIGPVFALPIRFPSSPPQTPAAPAANEVIKKYVYIAPKALNITGRIEPEIRYRGIYQAALFLADLKLTGRLPDLNLQEMNLKEEDVIWEKAQIVLKIGDIRGLRGAAKIKIEGKDYEMRVGETHYYRTGFQDYDKGGVQVKINDLREIEGKDFSLNLKIQGSEDLRIAPLGRSTTVELESSWRNPSFNGDFLPVKREINSQGFSARWEVSEFNGTVQNYWDEHQWNGSTFGVKLFSSVDGTQSVERAMKYGVLTLIFTFTVFFVLESISGMSIHPLQYGLIGAGLVLFYLILLSLTEVAGFNIGYLSAATIMTTIIALYTKAILQARSKAFQVAGALFSTYFFLYIVLRLEDFALVVGSFGLTLCLAALMFVTRNINENRVDSELSA